MTLEKKLVRLRKKEGMSQADVSEKLQGEKNTPHESPEFNLVWS